MQAGCATCCTVRSSAGLPGHAVGGRAEGAHIHRRRVRIPSQRHLFVLFKPPPCPFHLADHWVPAAAAWAACPTMAAVRQPMWLFTCSRCDTPQGGLAPCACTAATSMHKAQSVVQRVRVGCVMVGCICRVFDRHAFRSQTHGMASNTRPDAACIHVPVATPNSE